MDASFQRQAVCFGHQFQQTKVMRRPILTWHGMKFHWCFIVRCWKQIWPTWTALSCFRLLATPVDILFVLVDLSDQESTCLIVYMLVFWQYLSYNLRYINFRFTSAAILFIVSVDVRRRCIFVLWPWQSGNHLPSRWNFVSIPITEPTIQEHPVNSGHIVSGRSERQITLSWWPLEIDT